MWIIISTAIPIVLSIYGLSRLQQNRNSHGAQGPTSNVYNHENPDLRRNANILQTAEEKDAEAYKYLVKWDSDEELELSSNVVPLLDSALTAQNVKKEKWSGKRKRTEVKWDAFEEK